MFATEAGSGEGKHQSEKEIKNIGDRKKALVQGIVHYMSETQSL